MSDLLVTDVVTGGRVRAATRPPEGAVRAPRLAVQGRGEAGAAAWWRSLVRGGGWQVHSASPRECVLRGPVPGLCGPKRTATQGTRASGLLPDASPAALVRGCHSSPGPRRGVLGRAGAARPPRWLLRVCLSVRPSVRRGRGEAQGGVQTAAAARKAEQPFPRPRSGLSLQSPSGLGLRRRASLPGGPHSCVAL